MEFESDDEAITWMKAICDAFRRAHEQAAIAEMEESLSGPDEASNMAPQPGHCHPYYANHRDFIVNWLNGVTNYGYHLMIPVSRPARFLAADEPLDRIGPTPMTVLSKRRAWWPAPYVGRPFIYVWEVGEDKYGRYVAGDVTDRVHVPEHEVRIRQGLARFDGPQYKDSFYE